MTSLNHDNENNKRNKIIPDGGRFRVPMTAMDSMDEVQRAVAGRQAQIVDGNGDSGLALNRPGYRVVNDAHSRVTAYHDYKHELTNAWRGGDQSGTQEGAKSSEDEDETGNRRRRRRAQYRDAQGQETGTEEWESEDGEQARATATDAAYQQYEADLRDAYKNRN